MVHSVTPTEALARIDEEWVKAFMPLDGVGTGVDVGEYRGLVGGECQDQVGIGEVSGLGLIDVVFCVKECAAHIVRYHREGLMKDVLDPDMSIVSKLWNSNGAVRSDGACRATSRTTPLNKRRKPTSSRPSQLLFLKQKQRSYQRRQRHPSQ